MYKIQWASQLNMFKGVVQSHYIFLTTQSLIETKSQPSLQGKYSESVAFCGDLQMDDPWEAINYLHGLSADVGLFWDTHYSDYNTAKHQTTTHIFIMQIVPKITKDSYLFSFFERNTGWSFNACENDMNLFYMKAWRTTYSSGKQTVIKLHHKILLVCLVWTSFIIFFDINSVKKYDYNFKTSSFHFFSRNYIYLKIIDIYLKQWFSI